MIVGLAALLAAGCAGPRHTPAPRLPEPIRFTRRPEPPPPPRVDPLPPKTLPKVAAKKTRDASPLRVKGLVPRGGIKKSRWKAIVVHHSATPQATPQSMHSDHLDRGWVNGLGYHFVIGNGVNYPDGKIFAGPRWAGQKTGAHCKNGSGRFFGVWRNKNYYNEHGIGICLIGNFENSRPTRKQLQSLDRLLAYLTRHAGVATSAIHGHKEVTRRTACPGRRMNLARIRRDAGRIEAGVFD
jgi:hypothetical protein